ncbi:MAG: hypothetical protein ACJ72H_03710, partial [Candidatus Sulfotelmatobacter sp.]
GISAMALSAALLIPASLIAQLRGATEEQVEAHRHAMRQTGQGSSHIRLRPNRKNLLRIDWDKL